MRVKILGAGSIGNHLAHASRELGHQVYLCDIDRDALLRAKTEIYPGRYGSWDNDIKLFEVDDAPIGGFDLIIVGTPPDTHIPLARQVLEEKPKALLVEKPLSSPLAKNLDKLVSEASNAAVKVFVGYDHVLAKSVQFVRDLLTEKKIGEIITFDVEFREHWGGIFDAHPWLAGPHESYLGYTDRGGGALCEHSHALNLWQHFAHVLGYGHIEEVQADVKYVDDALVRYDAIAAMNILTQNGAFGRVIQDVVTKPAHKAATFKGELGSIDLIINFKKGLDRVVVYDEDGHESVTNFEKTRPDDFIQEISHIEDHLNGRANQHHILLDRGIETMLVIMAALRSSQTKNRVNIDWKNGYDSLALYTQFATKGETQ